VPFDVAQIAARGEQLRLRWTGDERRLDRIVRLERAIVVASSRRFPPTPTPTIVRVAAARGSLPVFGAAEEQDEWQGELHRLAQQFGTILIVSR
jgi:hypothetical protein